MSNIKECIEKVNSENHKALTIFLTSGFPNTGDFIELALKVVDAGADILEIGLPFGDSLADGPVIQSSYMTALQNKVNTQLTLDFISEIKKQTNIPIILMGSSNLIHHYGKKNFSDDAFNAGVSGLIIPDVPLEEYDDFYDKNFLNLDTILLTTPTSAVARIEEIDKKSSGFVYCVSVVGTTGVRKEYDDYVLDNLEKTYKIVSKNKMQIGFGISNKDNIYKFSPYCDGVIVGSAIIKSLANDDSEFKKTVALIKDLKSAC